MSVCRIHEKDTWTKCPRDAWEGDPDGLCLLHSKQENKDQDGRFTDAVKKQLDAGENNFREVFFPGPVNFSRREFSKTADFFMATFSGGADFSGATFSGKGNKAIFLGAAFNGMADFSGATFSGEAVFSGAIFSGGANFIGVTFWEKVSFYESTFPGEAAFDKAIFSGEALFFKSAFNSMVHFNLATISATGRVFLLNLNPPDKQDRSVPFMAKFLWLRQELGGRLRFQDISLAQVSFIGTDLRKVEFDRVTWGRKWLRDVVYDEILLHQRRWAHISYLLKYGGFLAKRHRHERRQGEPKNDSFAYFALVEHLYRHLKINYEEERDFKRVGDFHYGEMEMHRRGSFWRQWVPFSWHNLYRVLSGYGERPLRAFIWLLLLIPAWAGLVWGLGINQAGSQNPINYWDTFLFMFEKATLQRPEWPKGITWLGKVLGSFSVLLLPGQAALFILALRNRLGRRR